MQAGGDAITRRRQNALVENGREIVNGEQYLAGRAVVSNHLDKHPELIGGGQIREVREVIEHAQSCRYGLKELSNRPNGSGQSTSRSNAANVRCATRTAIQEIPRHPTITRASAPRSAPYDG